MNKDVGYYDNYVRVMVPAHFHDVTDNKIWTDKFWTRSKLLLQLLNNLQMYKSC